MGDDPRRDDFPNNFVGDLVPTDHGWMVVPPTCCPDGHNYGDDGWSVSSVRCTCNGRHMAWRCWCGAVFLRAAAGAALPTPRQGAEVWAAGLPDPNRNRDNAAYV
jgi:hypothetical protein